MKWALFVMLIASAALAHGQKNGQIQPTAQGNSYARQSMLRRQGSETLSREQARSKQELCVEAEKGGNAEIGRCLDEQFKTTERDYLTYVRTIGALLRLPDGSASANHGRLPFDAAEDAWLKYRDASCASMATQWEGGDQAPVAYSDCRLKLTWNHLNELADLYSDMWDGRTTSPAKPALALPEALAPALAEVKAKSRIAVLLPSELSEPLAKAKHAIVETASENEYAISLYYELGVGDSGFAASFMANAHSDYGPKDLPNVDEVKLSRRLVGYFRPVSCGGSCAPANLWWEEDRILYQIQLKLSSTLPENDQQRVIIAAANSAILAGPR